MIFLYGHRVRNRKFYAYENPFYRSRESTHWPTFVWPRRNIFLRFIFIHWRSLNSSWVKVLATRGRAMVSRTPHWKRMEIIFHVNRMFDDMCSRHFFDIDLSWSYKSSHHNWPNCLWSEYEVRIMCHRNFIKCIGLKMSLWGWALR